MASGQRKGKDTGCGDEDTEDIEPRDAFAQQYCGKEGTEQRRGGEQRLGNRGTMKRVVGKRLQQIIEKRLAEAGDEEEWQVTQLEQLESEEGTATAEEADEQHQQDRRHKTQDDERERRQDSQRMLDSDAADRPDDHRDDE